MLGSTGRNGERQPTSPVRRGSFCWMFADLGTLIRTERCPCMNEPLSILLENSIQIAWDYLERTGELGDPAVASPILLASIEGLIRRGERRKLMLSNNAIAAYKRFKADQCLKQPSQG